MNIVAVLVVAGIVGVIVWAAYNLGKEFGWWHYVGMKPTATRPSVAQTSDADPPAVADILRLLRGPNIVPGEWLVSGTSVHLRVIRIGNAETEIERVDSSAFTDRMVGTVLEVDVIRLRRESTIITLHNRSVTVQSARVVPRPHEPVPRDAEWLVGSRLHEFHKQLREAKLWS